jgi:lipoprotein signal peptidase
MIYSSKNIISMKEFFKSMFSNGDGVSSKRFSAFFALFNIVILAYIATFKAEDGATPEFMYDGLALIAGGGLGLTVVEKIFSKKSEEKNVQSPGKCHCGNDPLSCPNCKK